MKYNHSKTRPEQVKLAIFLLITSQVLGLLISTIAVSNVLQISGIVGKITKEILIFTFLLLPIYIWIFIKIAQGKNWARIAYIPIYFIFLLWHSTWAPVIGLSSQVSSYQIWIFIGHLPLAYALYLLFTNPASSWFQTVPTPIEAPHNRTHSESPPTLEANNCYNSTAASHASRPAPLSPPTNSTNGSETASQQAWRQVSDEIERNFIDKGLWTRCFAESDGDENKTKARYMQARQQTIFQDWQKGEAAKQIINTQRIEEENAAKQKRHQYEKDNAQKIKILKKSIGHHLQNDSIWKHALKNNGYNFNKTADWYIEYCIENYSKSDYENLSRAIKYKDKRIAFTIIAFLVVSITLAGFLSPQKFNSYSSTEALPAVEATATPIPELDGTAPVTQYVTPPPEAQSYLNTQIAPKKYPDINSEQTDLVANAPKFADFSASDYYYGPAAPVQIGSKGTDEYLYRTRLKSTQKEPMNFAGHYTLATWGCGTGGCIEGAIVDKRNGKVIWLPSYVIDWEGEGFRMVFKPESRLLILAGNVGDKEEYGINIYALVNDDFFQRIHFIPQTKPEPSY